jgi:hypothetical protein
MKIKSEQQEDLDSTITYNIISRTRQLGMNPKLD